MFRCVRFILLNLLLGIGIVQRSEAEILTSFEEPSDGQSVFGSGMIRGWAFSSAGTVQYIQFFIDGTPWGSITCCSARPDVAATFPGFPQALNSGWSMSFDYGLLVTGGHTISINIGDDTGASISITHMFTVIEPPMPSLCGNQIVEPGERCDDGNTTAGDGCSATCQAEIPLPRNLLRCQQSIGGTGQQFLQSILTARQSCLNRQLNGKLSLTLNCRAIPSGDLKTDNAVRRAENTLRSKLHRNCEGTVLEALGFPGQCSNPGGIPFTMEDLQQCIQMNHTMAVEGILNREYVLP